MTTDLGAGEDMVERGVHVPKDHMIGQGDEVTVWGVLDVVDHPGASVGGVWVPALTEIRVVGYVRAIKSKE